jgi:CubicO group peptidase (beta-lactamase class C family)
MRLVSLAAFALTVALGAGSALAVPIHDFAPVDAQMQSFVQTHALPGASLRVSRAGNVLHRRAYGGYDVATRVRIASASKWLSALVIARLVERGTMRWDDPVGAYFPQVAADKTGITLEQLFSHTSGLPSADNSCLSNPLFTLATCAERILQSSLIGTPGRVFAYGGNSMQVAGRMAEIATGKTWDDLMIAELVVPLGLVATDFATSSTAPGYVRNANPRIAGGARSTLDDYGQVVDMVLARGCLDGGFPDACPEHRRYLARATLDGMALDRTVGTTILSTPFPGAGYGIGQWIENADGVHPQTALPILSSPGAFGLTPWVDHVNGTAGVLLVEDSLSALNADIVRIRAQINATTAATRGRRVRPVQPPQAATPRAVAAPMTPAPMSPTRSRDPRKR